MYLLDIIDTSGVEEYYEIRKESIRNSDVILLCYEVTSKKSWEYVVENYDLIKDTKKSKEYQVILVCLKYDLIDEDCELDWKEIESFQKLYNLRNIMASSKIKYNVDEVFNQVILNPLEDEIWIDLEKNKFEKYKLTEKVENKKCTMM